MNTSLTTRTPAGTTDLTTNAKGTGPAAWSNTTICAILILLSVLPYCNSLLNGFVYDDTTQILDNPYILSFHYLGRIFSTTVWSYIGTHAITNYYRPMMTFGYLLCVQIFGPAPIGFHFANLLLNAAVVCVLYLLTQRMFGNRGMAIFAALLFALHPKHTEPVNWIAAVTDLEVTLFFLLTFCFFLLLSKQKGKRAWWPAGGMVVSFVLTIFSKEQALMFPPLVTIFEHFYRDDRAQTSWKVKFLRYAPFWILSLAYIGFRTRVFGGFAPLTLRPHISRYEAVLSGVALVGQYLLEVFRPFHLSAFYPFTPVSSVLSSAVLGSGAATLACAAAFAFLWRRHRAVSFGFVWFFATLAPVLDVRMLASDNAFAERYLYLPSVGFCWLAGYVLMKLWKHFSLRGRIWQWAWAGCLVMVAASFMSEIVVRNRVWRSEMVLDAATLLDDPDAVPIYNNLAAVYWNQGNLDEAEQLWRKALWKHPDSSTILNNLGLVAMRRNDMPLAVAYFKRSIQLQRILPDAHLNLGHAYQKLGHTDQAEAEYHEAMRLAPLNLHVYNRLGLLYLDEGRVREAERQFTTSVSIAPNVVAYDALGGILLERRSYSAAEEMFKRSVSLNPDNVNAREQLAGLYQASGRTAMAKEQYQAILKIDPHNAAALKSLQKLRESVTSDSHATKK
jgi:tetratricopeptide (TPR) repeat protein